MTDSQMSAARRADERRTEDAVMRARKALRAADRELKSAQDAGVGLGDARALLAVLTRATRALLGESTVLEHVEAREAGRQSREAGL